MPMKVYAEDLEKLEDELENVESELAEHRAKPLIIRRLLKSKIQGLEQRAYQLSQAVSSAQEHVRADETSAALYEGRRDERDKARAAKRRRKALGKQHDTECEPE